MYTYSNRTVPGVLVQDIKILNPGARTVQLALEKLGIAQWETANSFSRVIEHGEGVIMYGVVTGVVESVDKNMVVTVEYCGEKHNYPQLAPAVWGGL